jgi:hypothetical protein
MPVWQVQASHSSSVPDSASLLTGCHVAPVALTAGTGPSSSRTCRFCPAEIFTRVEGDKSTYRVDLMRESSVAGSIRAHYTCVHNEPFEFRNEAGEFACNGCTNRFKSHKALVQKLHQLTVEMQSLQERHDAEQPADHRKQPKKRSAGHCTLRPFVPLW